jgi:cellulose synthase/poly-beta-1,6-N-acetylglucosamine synthase-like glycosyltransferase
MDDNLKAMTGDPLALSRLRPEWSARVPITAAQRATLVGLSAVLLAVAVWKPWLTARAFVLVATLFYALHALYKLILVRRSVGSNAEFVIEPEDLAALRDEDLPVYSIMVPMYHERESVGHLVQALRKMDYPPDKLDVQLLLEADDDETREAVAAIALPPGFRVTVVPVSQPRTKPKACNVGLDFARGEYLVIYDAEDHPEPDQLKKAVIGFQRAGERVICLQSRLNFYNPRQNLITRLFTAEYSAWFDLSLPGLSASRAVIPLGGTSNHFVTARLRELLGWDAFNVTEDCDLGIRIQRAGYGTRMLRTTTWEEACSRIRFWIPQRTRWIKGYIQTYLVHMRNPRLLLRELGLAGFLHFQVVVGGATFATLLNPFFWFLALLWFLFRIEALTSLFPGPVFALGVTCLFAGNFVFVYLGAIGCYRRRYWDLVHYALLAPAYWVMMSYSGWRAFFQFFADPFKWEKTGHGLCKQSPVPATGPGGKGSE